MNLNRSALLFTPLMMLSGLAGIAYEVLYGRMLGNLIGDQFAVSAAILITFLLGIGIGSVYAHRLWSRLWQIEAAIGLCGLFFALNAPLLDSWLYAIPTTDTPLFDPAIGSIIICFVLLIVPALLIGCSLPLFAGYLSRLQSQSAFSRAYASYNFGAALTALLIEFLLIRWFGIKGTVIAIATVNGIIALVLRFGFHSLACQPAEAAPQPNPTAADQNSTQPLWHNQRSELAALIVASVASAVFQLLMLRLSELLLGPFRETFALVISLILLGIAVGSLLVQWFKLTLSQVLMIALLGLLLLLITLEPGIYRYAELYPEYNDQYASSVLLKWGLMALLLGLPAIGFGATLPALLTRNTDLARRSGRLLLLSALANCGGFLLMVLLLHQLLDYGQILLFIVLLTGVALLLASRCNAPAAIVVTLVCVSAATLQQQRWDENLLYLSYTNFRDHDSLDQGRDELQLSDRYRGHQDIFSINWRDGTPYFFINGYTSIPLTNPSEKLVGAVSSLFAPRNDRALVLGLGSGATASAVGQLFKHTDVIEINPVVRDNLHRMAQWNYGIEQNPRVNIIVDDAIHFSKASTQQYSLILNTVTTPLYFSSAKLYTDDFFKVVRQRLTDDGLYVTWIDSRIGDQGIAIILKTLASNFNQCGLAFVKSSYHLLLCSQQPIRAHQPLLAAQNSVINNDLLQQHGIQARHLAYSLLAPNILSLADTLGGKLNTNNSPNLEFSIARLSDKGMPRFKKALRRLQQPEALQTALAKLPYDAVELALFSHLRIEDSPFNRIWQRRLLSNNAASQSAFDLALLQHYRLRAKAQDSTIAYQKLGYQLLKHERYAEAVDTFNRVLQADPEYNNANFNLASSHEHLRQLDQARDFYLAELRVDPDDDDVRYRLARVAYKKGDFEDATRQIQLALGQQASARHHYFYGKILEAQRRTDDAVRAYRRAIQQDAKYSKARKALQRMFG
ncbi:MAG: tetratricopeptide repeat protein [Halopseudomonas sp.]